MRRHLSPPMVVAMLALGVALGGTSYAVVQLPRNSVGNAQLKRDAVTATKIKAGAVTASELRTGAVTSAKVRDRSLRAKDFAAGQLPAGPGGAQGVPGVAGPQGVPGERGAQGERGPSEAYKVTGPAPVGLVPGAAVEVASITVPAGAYTVQASGFVYPSGPANGGADQFICSIRDASDGFAASMPSQMTLTSESEQQYHVLGAGTVAAGKLRVVCVQVANGAADPAFTQLSATLVATRVGQVVTP